jgi:hypothetical protein
MLVRLLNCPTGKIKCIQVLSVVRITYCTFVIFQFQCHKIFANFSLRSMKRKVFDKFHIDIFVT